MAFTLAFPLPEPPLSERVPNFVGVVGKAICAVNEAVLSRLKSKTVFMHVGYHAATTRRKRDSERLITLFQFNIKTQVDGWEPAFYIGCLS